MRERDLERHFQHRDAEPGPSPAPAPPLPLPEGEPSAGAGGEKVDLQLARGLEVLKSWTYFERLRHGGTAEAAAARPAVANASGAADPPPPAP
jgi:hypothetical protein